MHLYPTILQKAPLRVSINAILNKIQDLDKIEPLYYNIKNIQTHLLCDVYF